MSNLPKYQPVNTNPTFWEVNKFIRPTHAALGVLGTFIGTVGGIIYGYPSRAKVGFISFLMVASTSYLMCIQSSFARLQGFRENSRELKKAGIEPKELTMVVKRMDLEQPGPEGYKRFRNEKPVV